MQNVWALASLWVGLALIRRLRTLRFGLLTPFHFIRAGSFVSVPGLIAAPLVFLALFGAKKGSYSRQYRLRRSSRIAAISE
jgi:hypothetical protein